jgi:hypothetical protein
VPIFEALMQARRDILARTLHAMWRTNTPFREVVMA